MDLSLIDRKFILECLRELSHKPRFPAFYPLGYPKILKGLDIDPDSFIEELYHDPESYSDIVQLIMEAWKFHQGKIPKKKKLKKENLFLKNSLKN